MNKSIQGLLQDVGVGLFIGISMIIFFVLISGLANAAPIMESTSVISATVSGSSGDSIASGTASDGLSGRTSAGGGFTCNDLLWIEKDYCKTFCPKYIKLNNCSNKPASSHLCCTTYYKEDATLIISNTTETPNTTNPTINNTAIIIQTKTDWISPIIIFGILISIGILTSIESKNKKQIEALKNNTGWDTLQLKDYIQRQKKRGFSKRHIIEHLVKHKWDKDLSEAVAKIVYDGK